VGIWRLVAGPPHCDTISVALDLDGARVVLDHARAIVRRDPALAEAIEIRANSLLYGSADSRWTITSREHTASRGRHPDLVLYDEAAWSADDELFSSLLAGQASVDDPLMLVTSTVGRRQAGPLWTIKELAEAGDPHVFWSWHS
jgi:phage terminase large subunit-like protein